jgi:hypothetical protein
MNRPLQPGDVCYIRVRVIARVDDKEFGQFTVEPVNRFQVPSRPGMYTYMNRDEIITIEEARRIVK